jgi:hypothetical protein
MISVDDNNTITGEETEIMRSMSSEHYHNKVIAHYCLHNGCAYAMDYYDETELIY